MASIVIYKRFLNNLYKKNDKKILFYELDQTERGCNEF